MAQFPGVEEVLRYAHRWEAASLIKSPSVQMSSRGSDPANMTPLDHVAQSAMILAMVRRALPAREVFTLRLLYIIPADTSLRTSKDSLITECAAWIHRMNGRPLWWISDVLREWSGMPARNDLKWWSQHLDKSERTLIRWAKARNAESVYSIVDAELQRAHGRLWDVMREAGYVE